MQDDFRSHPIVAALVAIQPNSVLPLLNHTVHALAFPNTMPQCRTTGGSQPTKNRPSSYMELNPQPHGQ